METERDKMKRCPKCNRLNTDTAEYCLCGKHKWEKDNFPDEKYNSDFFGLLNKLKKEKGK